jgi:hypothetical protein
MNLIVVNLGDSERILSFCHPGVHVTLLSNFSPSMKNPDLAVDHFVETFFRLNRVSTYSSKFLNPRRW